MYDHPELAGKVANLARYLADKNITLPPGTTISALLPMLKECLSWREDIPRATSAHSRSARRVCSQVIAAGGRKLDIVQTVETTVASRLTPEALHFVVVPRRSFADPRVLDQPDTLIVELGLEAPQKLDTTSDLVLLFSALLSSTPSIASRTFGNLTVPLDLMDSARADLAHRAVEDLLIPSEESPLDSRRSHPS